MHAPNCLPNTWEMSAKLRAKYGLYQKEKGPNKYIVIIYSQYYEQYLAEISELFIKHCNM